jgi:hypothetical protein
LVIHLSGLSVYEIGGVLVASPIPDFDGLCARRVSTFFFSVCLLDLVG